MNKPEKIKYILKLLQESNSHLIKSNQMQNEANIAVMELIQDIDTSITSKIHSITTSEEGALLNVQELSLLINVSIATIYNWIKKNSITYHNDGNKIYFKKFELSNIILRYKK